MMALENNIGFVGRIGIYHPYDLPEPQLSYFFSRRGWGKGYATEAAALLRARMVDTHHPKRLVSHIAPDTFASARVASKLGAVRDGTTVHDGASLDVWAYPTPV
jgi:[ribosomal protein S5]-alanine N-acetyltransferase